MNNWREIANIPDTVWGAYLWGVLDNDGHTPQGHSEEPGNYWAWREDGAWWTALDKDSGGTWPCQVIATHWHPPLGRPDAPRGAGLPHEPTDVMVEAGNLPLGCRRDCYVGRLSAAKIWRAMAKAYEASNG